MKSSKSNSSRIIRWLRIIHRDLGYLMVGICLVYGISGMLLNHMNGKDPAYKSTNHTIHMTVGLGEQELASAWNADSSLPKLKKAIPIDEQHTRLMLDGGMGVYNSATGLTDYELHKKNVFVYWINKLHYNKVNGWSIMGDIFAVSLIFFAVSGLFMVRGKKGLLGRGKWFLAAGLLIPILYILFT